ncbi:isochorismate synthase [Gordonia zhaorongruii]|uniref:isochorismate synthase n=1 Tax=Gordonia zhaorongruii TaxID=2597659 RepID=UPI0010456FC6|nr:isochorismate synthase [Gordonia zhaorongruii]
MDLTVTEGATDEIGALTAIAPMTWRSSAATVTSLAQTGPGPAAAAAPDFARAMSDAARSAAHGRAFAALPFDRSRACAITIPTADDDPVGAGDVPPFLDGGRSSAGAYRDGVRLALDRFTTEDLQKVVLARYRDLISPDPCEPLAIAARLVSGNPLAHVFAIPVGPGKHLVGASPELLIAKSGNTIRSHPLAGSAHRHADSSTDARTADALIESEKDRREHAYVVEAICDLLAPYCSRLAAPDPSLLATDSMWHLGTEITAELRDPDTPVAQLAALLHPTPAVCGTPRAAAYRMIDDVEHFDRGFFAGAAGWMDEAGDGEWVVSIRCGEVGTNRIRAYAGAGIVAGSDPDAELAETEGKLSTFLAAVALR